MILFSKPIKPTVEFLTPAFAVIVDGTVRALFFYLEDAKKYLGAYPDNSEIVVVSDKATPG